jgi:cytochrome c-type biogenesis protein CcmH
VLMRSLLLAVGVALLLALAPGVAASEPRASLPDIEDEVMCPTCGVPLGQAFSPQAERERRFIRHQIALGKTKEQIKQALVSEFGERVLATPRDEGFDLVAYLVPAIAVGLAAAAILFGLLRWRRNSPDPATPAPGLSPTDSARLERDLSRYEP